MQIANVLVALGGDQGNTVPKFSVTPAELALLRLIHGDDAVRDISPCGTVVVSAREERNRLLERYPLAKVQTGGSAVLAVDALFPGIAARLPQTFSELDIPDEFYMATERMNGATEADDEVVEDIADEEAAPAKPAKKARKAEVAAAETSADDNLFG